MPKLAGLQLLRGMAAMMVLVGHVIAEAEHYFGVTLGADLIPWTRGVDIFFVISGFIITLSAPRFIGQPLAFLWRRFLRVAPLYYLFTTLMVLSLVVLPGGAKDTIFDPGQMFSSYLFLPYERYDGRIAPVLSLGWTLNYEMFFYALMALALAMPRPIWAVTGMLTGCALLGLSAPSQNPFVMFWSNPLVLEFLFGIMLARAWQRGFRRPAGGLAIALVISGFALLILADATPLPRFLAAGVPATLIVAAGTLFCPGYNLPGQAIGDASYALYLSHRFTLRALTLSLLPLFPSGIGEAWIYVSVSCAIAVVVSLVIYARIEHPLLRLFSHAPNRRVTA